MIVEDEKYPTSVDDALMIISALRAELACFKAQSQWYEDEGNDLPADHNGVCASYNDGRIMLFPDGIMEGQMVQYILPDGYALCCKVGADDVL